jgi:hypothetical protein
MDYPALVNTFEVLCLRVSGPFFFGQCASGLLSLCFKDLCLVCLRLNVNVFKAQCQCVSASLWFSLAYPRFRR